MNTGKVIVNNNRYLGLLRVGRNRLVESWKKSLDEKAFEGEILKELSNAFDTLNHKILIAKLHAYGFDKSSLKLLHAP